MSLSTLTLLKAHLGVTDTSQDTALTQWLAQASAVARGLKKQYIGGMISANTVANPTVVTAVGHGLETGQTVYIRGSNCTPSIDGPQAITRISRDTFSVAVNVTVAGTAGTYGLVPTEYYSGDGTDRLLLRQRPVQSISSVYVDADGYFGEGSSPFASADLLTAGTDYCLLRDTSSAAIEQSSAGILLRINDVWPAAIRYEGSYLAPDIVSGKGNVKVTYVAGYASVPEWAQLAAHVLVAIMRRTAALGASASSESLDYYSYSLASDSQAQDEIASVKNLLGLKADWVW